MWFVWWTLHVFAQVVGFLVSPKNGSGSTKDTTYPSWTPQMRIYFLDPSGGLGWWSHHLLEDEPAFDFIGLSLDLQNRRMY